MFAGSARTRLAPVGLVIDEILLLDEGSVESDWASGVLYLPLR